MKPQSPNVVEQLAANGTFLKPLGEDGEADYISPDQLSTGNSL